MRINDITLATQDLRYLSWDECRSPSGMGGARPKAREGTGANAVYYKLAPLDGTRRAQGPENANQLLCTRLARMLGFPTADCRLLRARVVFGGEELETWVLRSKSYRSAGERGMSLEDFCNAEAVAGENPAEFCLRMGWGEQLGRIALLDYLTANRGRDGSGIEVLCDPRGHLRLSPLTGGSFSLCSAFPRRLWRLDPLAELPSAGFPKSGSLQDNLALVPGDLTVEPLRPSSRRELMRNMDAAFNGDDDLLEGSWQIIWRRWQRYARVRGV